MFRFILHRIFAVVRPFYYILYMTHKAITVITVIATLAIYVVMVYGSGCYDTVGHCAAAIVWTAIIFGCAINAVAWLLSKIGIRIPDWIATALFATSCVHGIVVFPGMILALMF